MATFDEYVKALFSPNYRIENGVLVNEFGMPVNPEEYTNTSVTVPPTSSASNAPSALESILNNLKVPPEFIGLTGSYQDYLLLDSDIKDYWSSLSYNERAALSDAYDGNFKQLRADLEALAEIGAAPNIKLPVSSEIYSKIDAELNPAYAAARSRLDTEESLMRQDYQDQLQSSADLYNQRASGLLSNQYLSNAQTYDALQSDMRKARQNALEAGASAGIRLAGNVNALLTAQNKQSQTAMDTSNALADMLLQQRNAAAGIRSDYRGYMSNLNQRRTDLDTQQRTEREGLFNQRHSNAVNDYNDQWNRWSERFDTLPASNKAASSYQTYMRNQAIK